MRCLSCNPLHVVCIPACGNDHKQSLEKKKYASITDRHWASKNIIIKVSLEIERGWDKAFNQMVNYAASPCLPRWFKAM